ncbi:MAG: hypothetical protein AB7H81_17280 [Vicinamibacterales bacterium]
MWTGRTPLQDIRRVAGPVLLGVFVVAAQLAPAAHLATHRNDHSHGPEFGTLDDAAHDAAHRAGLPHDHGDELTPEERAWLNGDDAPIEYGDGTAATTGDAAPPHSHGSPLHDHGRGSVAHFGVALVEGPPPPLVPPPAETIAPPPDARARDHRAPARPQPPARGPPA